MDGHCEMVRLNRKGGHVLTMDRSVAVENRSSRMLAYGHTSSAASTPACGRGGEDGHPNKRARLETDICNSHCRAKTEAKVSQPKAQANGSTPRSAAEGSVMETPVASSAGGGSPLQKSKSMGTSPWRPTSEKRSMPAGTAAAAAGTSAAEPMQIDSRQSPSLQPLMKERAAGPSPGICANREILNSVQDIPDSSAAKASTSGAGPAHGSNAADDQLAGLSRVETSGQAAAAGGPPPQEPSTPSAHDEAPSQAAAHIAVPPALPPQRELVEEVQNGASAAVIAAVNQKYGLETRYKVEPEEAAYVAGQLEKYRKEVKRLQATGQKKPDMKAFGDNNKAWKTPLDRIGHIRGAEIGTQFNGKGELAITGIHANISAGIYSKKTEPCYAIVLSGGYADDHDGGEVINYTGMGKQSKGRQVGDQDWDARGNHSLKLSFHQGTPVRVARGETMVKRYDGLYRVTRAWKERGQDGFVVCMFRLVPIPGHSMVSERVMVRPRKAATSFAHVRAHLNVNLDGETRLRTKGSALGPPQQRPGFLCEDISDGAENVKIPAFNEVNDEQLDPLEYIRECVFGSEEAKRFAKQASDVYCHGTCGREIMGSELYRRGGFGMKVIKNVFATQQGGLCECVSSCTDSRCEANKVVTQGLKLPLEVFYTGPERRWGLRCAEAIPRGTFICEYAGVLISDQEANQLTGMDKYLWDMNDFAYDEKKPLLASPEVTLNRGMWIPPAPADPSHPSKRVEHVLVLNAQFKGNVARFMNHRCDGGNAFARGIVVEGNCSLLYKVAFFAHSDIEPLEELTYNYNWEADEQPDGNDPGNRVCKCGSAGCLGVFKF